LTFELAYRVDANDMDADRFPDVTKARPCLQLASGGDVEFVTRDSTQTKIRDFLCAQPRREAPAPQQHRRRLEQPGPAPVKLRADRLTRRLAAGGFRPPAVACVIPLHHRR